MSLIKLASLILLPLIQLVASESSSFTFNGFSSANLTLDGVAAVAENGLLHLANDTREAVGHAFYPTPIIFKNSSNSSLFSFSTHFVFAIVPDTPKNAGHGMTFVIAPAPRLPGSFPNIYLGLLNESSNGNSSNHVFAVELDQLQNSRFKEPDDNHVGIDVNSMVSVVAKPAAYYDGKTQLFRNLSLISGRPMQLWVDYDGVSEILNVTLAPVENGGFKPRVPLISLRYDLAPVLNQISYVGFSAAPLWTSYYVLGWSFSINGGAPPLDLSRLPKLPRVGPKKQSKFVTVGLPLISVFVLVMTVFIVAYYFRMKWKFAEILEDWETEYNSHRFKYKDLYKATKGFREGELLGRGGFGKVYRGVMPNSKIEVAVKKISHESWQGMKEFVAEIVSIGRLRHRNLVALLGYCRRKGELLLVYDYMPNGSLDKYLHNNPVVTLSWDQRFRVIKGAASGILYLHEEWEQVVNLVIHRDIKASNILLDGEFSARLGDFGLARLYDHGSDPQTTHIVGTLGYLAPEHTRTGRATTSTDVYSFGAFLLEVGCGRRPIEPKGQCEKSNLLEWVFSMWSKGEIVGAVDQNLGGNYDKNEVELVLKLGLLCCHSRPEVRPKMRDVVRFLEGEMDLPELAAVGFGESGYRFACYEGFDDLGVSYNFSSKAKTMSSGSTSVPNSVIFSGR